MAVAGGAALAAAHGQRAKEQQHSCAKQHQAALQLAAWSNAVLSKRFGGAVVHLREPLRLELAPTPCRTPRGAYSCLLLVVVVVVSLSVVVASPGVRAVQQDENAGRARAARQLGQLGAVALHGARLEPYQLPIVRNERCQSVACAHSRRLSRPASDHATDARQPTPVVQREA